MKAPSTLRVVRAIGWVTFSEIIRDKILYNIFVVAALLFAVGFLAAKLTFIRPERVTLDFGLSAVNLSCAMIAIFVGASLIGREFERRTIFVALARPISRAQFVLGKFVGIASVIVVNWLLLSTTYLLLLWASGGDLAVVITPTLFGALFLLLLQSFVIACVAVFFSTFSTTSLSIIMTIGIYLIGNNISQVKLVAARMKAPIGAMVLNSLAALLPNLESFNLGNRVTYGLPLESAYLAYASFYCLTLIAFVLLLAGLLIRGREI